MYEQQRKKLEPEFGGKVAFMSDSEIASILATRAKPGYRAALSQKEAADRAARLSENATKAKVEGVRDKAAQEAAQRLEHRRRVLLADWLHSGGDEQSFDDEWPRIKATILTGEAEQRAAEQEQTTRRRYKEMF